MWDGERTRADDIYLRPEAARCDREKFRQRFEPWEFKIPRIWLRPTDFSSPSLLPSTSSGVSIIRFGIAPLSLRRGEEEPGRRLLGSQVEFPLPLIDCRHPPRVRNTDFSRPLHVYTKITWKIARITSTIACNFLYGNKVVLVIKLE